ncbi:MAG: tetratricopeptide repeat protein [Sphingobium limneticum]
MKLFRSRARHSDETAPIEEQSSDIESFRTTLAAADDAQREQNWPTAARLYVKAIELHPEAVGLHMQAGHMLKESGDFDGAFSHYQLYLGHHEDDPDIYLQLGHLFNRRDDEVGAREWYERLLKKVQPHSRMAIDAYRSLDEIEKRPLKRVQDQVAELIRSRRFAEAADFLRHEAEKHEEPLIYIMLANHYRDRGEFDDAARYYDRCDQETSSPEVCFESSMQRGHMEKLRKKLLPALRCYVEARRRYSDRFVTSCSLHDVEAEINGIMARISRALMLVY